MLAASYTNLGETLSGPVSFLDFKDFMNLLISLGLAFGKSKFSNFLKIPLF